MEVAETTQSAEKILERMGDAYYEVDADWRIRYWNAAMESQTGYLRSEVLGANLWECISEFRGADVERSLRETMETREPVRFQSCSQPAGIGSVVQVYPTADGVEMYAREETSDDVNDHDIDPTQKRDLFQRVQAIANIGGWEIDLATETVTWTDEVYRIHGLSPDEFTPTIEAGIEFYHPEDRPLIETAVQNAIATGTEWDLELRLLTAEDEVIWVRAKGDVVYDGDEPRAIRGTFQDITGEHDRQQQLRESREQLRQIIDALPQFIWLKNCDGEYVLANEAIANAYGTTRDRLEGATDAEFAAARSGRDFREDDRAVLEYGETKAFVEPICDADGRERIVQTQLLPLQSVATDERFLLGIATDITEREEITRDLRERTQYLQQLYEVSATRMPLEEKIHSLLSVGSQRVGLDLGILSRIEDGVYTIESAYSATDEDFEGAQFDLAETYCEMTVAANGVVSFEQASSELEQSHPAYAKFGLESYIGVPLFVDDELYGTINFSSSDARTRPFSESEELFIKLISEWVEYRLNLKRREDELEESKRQLRQIIDIVPEPIFVKDGTGAYLLANQAAKEVLGIAMGDEVAGKSDHDLFPSDVADWIREDDLKVFESGDPFYIPAEELEHPDGTMRTYKTRKIPFENAREENLLLGVAVDITEIEQAQRKLAQAHDELVVYKDELEIRYSQLEFFDSLLRHDVLNSLTVIRGTAELALDEVTDEQVRQDIQTILDWSDDIVLLVKRVRHVIEVLTGEDTDSKPIDVESVLADEVARLSAAHPAARIDVESESKSKVLAAADDLLGEVLGNVIGNALSHTDTATPVVNVTVESSDDRVRVVVADNGPGVEESRKKTVFRRGETTHVKQSGSGFGLFFVDTMVSAYGGDVVVEDNEPRGARFVIELPKHRITTTNE